MSLTAEQRDFLDNMCPASQFVKMGTELKRIGDLTTNMSLAELAVIDGVTPGTQAAGKAVIADANVNTGVSKVTELHIGATGSETQVTSTGAELNVLDGITATTEQLNEAGDKASSASRLYNLGAPVVADVDRIVTTTNMVNSTYTIAAQPDVPRNITVTATAVDTADTMGTITIDGTDYQDNVIQEVITPAAGSTVAGALAFKTVTAVTGAGWAIDGVEASNDTITVGVGNELGLPLALDLTTEMMLGILGTAITAHNPTVGDPATISETTIDMSAGTYDGSKEALIFVVD